MLWNDEAGGGWQGVYVCILGAIKARMIHKQMLCLKVWYMDDPCFTH